MAFGMRSKKCPTGKPRVSFAGGRRKETGSGPRPSDRRNGSRDGVNRRRSKYESDGDDDYSFRGGNSQSNWKQRENPVRRESDVGLSGRKPSYGKRRDFTRDGSDVDSSSRGMRPSFGKGRDFTRNGSEGEKSSRGVSREMRPSYGKRRDFTRDGSNESSSGGVREMRPSYGKGRDFTRDGSEAEMSSRGVAREMRSNYGKRRDFTRDGSKEENSSRGVAREMSSSYGKRRDFTRDGSKEENSSRGVVREMRPNYDKRRDFTRDVSEGESSSRGVVREMRGERQLRRVDSYGSKETGGSDDFVEASDVKLRMKWKKMDKRRQDVDGDDSNAKGLGRRGKEDLSVENEKLRSKGRKMDTNVSMDRGKGDAMERSLEKDPKSEDVNDEIAEKKIMKRQRVIDKSGKKIRIAQKHSDDGSDAKDAPLKRKKRVIKLDPYDLSNKRLDDTIPNTDNAAEKDIESSKNAQFRAIQPSPSILSFVEDNLLGRMRLNELKNAGYNIKFSAPLDNVPFSTCTERDRIEENVFRNKLEFFAAAKISSSFPPPVIPEIAFAGRSNVGKSSLLNALTRQWGVVRTSDKPGLTQTINFFKLDSKLCLVDLPGYGFAYAKEEVKDAWEELVKEYVSTRVGLQKVCLLVDTKWGLKPRDHELIDLMERAQTPYQVVLTKTDVIFPIDVARHAMQIQETLKKNKSIVNPVMMVSSKSGAGVRSLRTVLAKLSRFIKP